MERNNAEKINNLAKEIANPPPAESPIKLIVWFLEIIIWYNFSNKENISRQSL